MPGVGRVLFNPGAAANLHLSRPGTGPRDYHRRLPGYAVTPLRELPALAGRVGVGRVVLKDESSRLGLPAFKILGASWAVYRTLVERLGREPSWATLGELVAQFAPLRPLALATATDGNHGRAVARMARLLGLEARIFVPAGTAAARIDAIRSEGAVVTAVADSYDDAVNLAAAEAGPDCIVISDQSWEGYDAVPRRVIEGYSTMFSEIDEQLGGATIDAVFVQVGVGALAAAMVTHYHATLPKPRPRIVAVEPADAACALESVAADAMVTLPGPHRSIMVGMNCGTVSLLAWPLIRDGIDCFVALDDMVAEDAMRSLAAEGVVSGETGCSGAAALIELLTGEHAREARARLHLGPASTVLLLSTEGATDPANWQRITGQRLPASTAG